MRNEYFFTPIQLRQHNFLPHVLYVEAVKIQFWNSKLLSLNPTQKVKLQSPDMLLRENLIESQIRSTAALLLNKMHFGDKRDASKEQHSQQMCANITGIMQCLLILLNNPFKGGGPQRTGLSSGACLLCKFCHFITKNASKPHRNNRYVKV